MKKFKRIFYAICLLPVLIVILIYLFQDSILFETESSLYMGRIGMAKFLIKLGGISLFLFVAEIIVENIHISSLNKKVAALEKEKLELKAKLYDESESLLAQQNSSSEKESDHTALDEKEPEKE